MLEAQMLSKILLLVIVVALIFAIIRHAKSGAIVWHMSPIASRTDNPVGYWCALGFEIVFVGTLAWLLIRSLRL